MTFNADRSQDNTVLLLVPGNSIKSYEKQGQGACLKSRYNPEKLFNLIYCIAPWESKAPRQAHGMDISRVEQGDFPKFISEKKPSVIRAENAEWAADLAVLQRPTGVPVVVHVHDPHPEKMRECLVYADYVVCVSETVKKNVIAKGVAPENIFVLYNRVNLNIFNPESSKRKDIEEIREKVKFEKFILHIGRRSPEKNISTVVSALRYLPEEYGAVFIGSGDESEYKELCCSAGVTHRCMWMDPVANEKLPAWYSACDVFCVPSLREAFGFIFAEAAACGAAIVTSNIGAMNEYLIHKESAFLVDEYEDPKQIAEAIKLVCEDSLLSEKLKNNAPGAVVEFDQKLLEKKEKELYQKFIKKGQRRLSLSESIKYSIWKAGKSKLVWAIRNPGFILSKLKKKIEKR